MLINFFNLLVRCIFTELNQGYGVQVTVTHPRIYEMLGT